MDLHLNINIIKPIFAADPVPKDVGTIGGIGLGPFGTFAQKLMNLPSKNLYGLAVGNELNAVISIFVGFLTAIASIWFIIRMVIGGIQWISAGGDTKAVQGAQQTITNGIIGLAIVMASYAIVSVMGTLFGLEILNPAKMLQLTPF